jgi:hypothetical protein
MESLEELSKTANGKPGFFKHVFNFDDDSKTELMNIVQYAILALIPVVILNKTMQRFVPEADDEKGNFEILAEIVGQVVVMFMGILLIHRIITFIPTYSGEKYGDFAITNIILAVLVIILSLQTKLGEKVSIIVDRVMEMWEGPKDDKKGKKSNKGQASVKVSQPIVQGQNAMNQSLNSMGTTSINTLPIAQPTTQALPDYNNMAHQEMNSGMNMGMASESFEPMAANAGGSSFGGAFW